VGIVLSWWLFGKDGIEFAWTGRRKKNLSECQGSRLGGFEIQYLAMVQNGLKKELALPLSAKADSLRAIKR
jgi:hypothetical protein